MRQFNVGQVVTWAPDMCLRHAAPGDYKIVAAMPDRDGDRMYRIKSPLEEYERAVAESLLIESDGYLPDEVPTRSACGKGDEPASSTQPGPVQQKPCSDSAVHTHDNRRR